MKSNTLNVAFRWFAMGRCAREKHVCPRFSPFDRRCVTPLNVLIDTHHLPYSAHNLTIILFTLQSYTVLRFVGTFPCAAYGLCSRLRLRGVVVCSNALSVTCVLLCHSTHYRMTRTSRTSRKWYANSRPIKCGRFVEPAYDYASSRRPPTEAALEQVRLSSFVVFACYSCTASFYCQLNLCLCNHPCWWFYQESAWTCIGLRAEICSDLRIARGYS